MVSRSEAIRSLTIIYGFFFVFMSGLLSGIPVIHPFLTEGARLSLYFLVWLLALAFLLIGFELVIAIMSELGSYARLGLIILSNFVPAVFILVLGTALVGDVYLFGRTLADIGMIAFLFFIASYVIAILVMARVRRK